MSKPGKDTMTGSTLLSPGNSSSFKEHAVDDTMLLETPIELCCPITQDIFKDPVITSAGQVYERAAILEALQHSSRDPITGLDIAPAQLTPVYLLRKSAQEYRDSTIRACIDRVCTADCPNPVKYLRRAVEMYSGGSTSHVPGLTSECITYLQTHQSNAYDVYALQVFAKGLQRGGHHDLAANVFHKLLQMGEDKAQQAEILKQCLQCWVLEYSSSDQDMAIAKLTEFIRSNQNLSCSQIIDIMCEANINKTLTRQTCEALLRQSSGDEDSRQFKELLLKYTHLSLVTVEAQLKDHDRRLSSIETGTNTATPAKGEVDSHVEELSDEKPSLWHSPAGKLPVSKKKLLTSAAVVLLNVVDCKHFLWRLLRAVPLVLLVKEGRD